MSRFEEAAAAFTNLCETIAGLRHPVDGCPWDLQQTHESLRRYMIEEAYEAARVMARADHDSNDSRELCEELGDVLLQVVLNAQVAADRKGFQIADVIKSIDAKMRRRHPHVFGSDEARQDREMSSIKSNWEVIKAEEKKNKSAATSGDGFFAGIKGYPATIEAYEIGKRAAKIKFDWNSPAEVLAKLLSEVDEMKDEWEKGDRAALMAELGDVYFSLAQFSRHIGVDPEVIALDGNRKFLDRFAKVEALAKKRGVKIPDADQATLESLWEDAKGL
jgi:tetrapyrrole methylase family protein/MazG family protein